VLCLSGLRLTGDGADYMCIPPLGSKVWPV
jgi:hypothetical protein